MLNYDDIFLIAIIKSLFHYSFVNIFRIKSLKYKFKMYIN